MFDDIKAKKSAAAIRKDVEGVVVAMEKALSRLKEYPVHAPARGWVSAAQAAFKKMCRELDMTASSKVGVFLAAQMHWGEIKTQLDRMVTFVEEDSRSPIYHREPAATIAKELQSLRRTQGASIDASIAAALKEAERQ